MAIEVVFMRHGRSRADDERVHEGRYDSPLTAVGEAQAQARAQAWLDQGVRFDTIIASPLLRAGRTAEIVGRLLKVPVEADPEWMEMDNGPLAGLPFEVAEHRYPTPAFHNPYQPLAGSGESDWELYCRAARAVERVIRRGPGRYLVVAHGGILNAAFRTIAGTPPLINRHGIWFALGDNGYARFHYDPARHTWVMLEFQHGTLDD